MVENCKVDDCQKRLLVAENEAMRSALDKLHSFVTAMVGRGPDAVIPETIRTPIGAPVKIGEIMREARVALETHGVRDE